MPSAESWGQHVLGKGLYLPAFVVTLPLFLLILAFMARYSLARSVSMLERIGSAEAQSTMLGRYFSPGVVAEITANPDTIMSGERKRVAILFSDIQGFTALSEGMEPDEIAGMLTDIRRIQIAAVFAHQGTVDKFIGDAIMTTFGTPTPSVEPRDDVLNAIRSGWAMLRGRLSHFGRMLRLAQDQVRATPKPLVRVKGKSCPCACTKCSAWRSEVPRP